MGTLFPSDAVPKFECNVGVGRSHPVPEEGHQFSRTISHAMLSKSKKKGNGEQITFLAVSNGSSGFDLITNALAKPDFTWKGSLLQLGITLEEFRTRRTEIFEFLQLLARTSSPSGGLESSNLRFVNDRQKRLYGKKVQFPCFSLQGFVGFQFDIWLVKDDSGVGLNRLLLLDAQEERTCFNKELMSRSFGGTSVNFLERLPPELRQMIFVYAFPTGHAGRELQEQPRASCSATDLLTPERFPMLFVCRQMRDEVLHCLALYATICFGTYKDREPLRQKTKAAPRFIWQLPGARLRFQSHREFYKPVTRSMNLLSFPEPDKVRTLRHEIRWTRYFDRHFYHCTEFFDELHDFIYVIMTRTVDAERVARALQEKPEAAIGDVLPKLTVQEIGHVTKFVNPVELESLVAYKVTGFNDHLTLFIDNRLTWQLYHRWVPGSATGNHFIEQGKIWWRIHVLAKIGPTIQSATQTLAKDIKELGCEQVLRTRRSKPTH